MEVTHTTSPLASSVCRVALVEDNDQVRNQWASLINNFDGFSCIHTCASGEAALKELPSLKPQIVLMDICLPLMSGIECTARLKEMSPETRVLILTSSNDEELVFPALEAGADGYLMKNSTPGKLRQSLQDSLQGGVPMTSGIARRVADFFRKRSKLRGEVKGLSVRETEVLDLLSKGYGNKEIADKLSLSVETIRSYLKNIYTKMHVHSRAEAVAKYITDSGGRTPHLRV